MADAVLTNVPRLPSERGEVRFQVPASVRDRLEPWLTENEKRGATYTVRIARFRKRRSLKANSKLHVICSGIAKYTGRTLEEVKLLVKFRAVMNRGYPVVEVAGVPWPKPSHLSDSEQISELIAEAQDLAVFFEVPEELWA